jgi:tetratricopeptide (TPR) repeat protein
MSPVDAGVYGMLHALYRRDGNAPEAERYRQLYAQRAQELEWEPAEQYEQLGGYLMSVGLNDEAATALREALRLGGDRAPVQARLGEALYRAGRLGPASDAYERALAVDPQLADAYLMLGKIHEAEGSIPKAIQDYDRFLASGAKGAGVAEAQQRLARLRAQVPASPKER